jgi:hypothetical protein
VLLKFIIMSGSSEIFKLTSLKFTVNYLKRDYVHQAVLIRKNLRYLTSFKHSVINDQGDCTKIED